MYDFRTVKFGRGSHPSRESGMCVMEAVAYIAGEPHSDKPECTCPVLAEFCRNWNDGLPSDEKRAELLGPFLWRLPGTKATVEIEQRRGEMALDWLVREQAPLSLETVPELVRHAEKLRGLPEIAVATVADDALPHIEAAWSAAESAARSAAESAAWSAARSAARSAALSAARSAALSAARSAAWSAARSAAWSAALSAAESAAESAAWSAARSAAWSAAKPIIQASWKSAVRLLDRMIRLTEPREELPPAARRRAKKLVGDFVPGQRVAVTGGCWLTPTPGSFEWGAA